MNKPKSIGKILKRTVAGFAALLALLTAVIAVDFAFFRGRTPSIDGASQSISSLECIDLGGVKQWILVRSRDRTKPVVLFLHGGPGMPAMYLAHDFQRELEKDFVVVHWDRRGAGKSYRAGATGDLSVRQTLDDIHELTRLLKSRFGKNRIYLVAHSWGTVFGVLAAREHPEDFAAYIGMGQMAATDARVNEARREFLLHQARAAGDMELQERLKSNESKITESDLFRYHAELFASASMWPLLRSGLQAPEYTFGDILNIGKGASMVFEKMRQDVIEGPLEEAVKELGIPVFFFLGRHDYNTPSQLAAVYLEALRAPFKKLVWFERSAHFPFFEEPEAFHRELLAAERDASRF